jgi:ankyrin repeat protein
VGVTALMLAAGDGHTSVVKTLIGSGSDINAKDEVGVTALTRAAVEGHTAIVQLLKQAGAKEEPPQKRK